MRCISVQDFLYATHFPSTRFVFRFRFSDEVCHISQQMASELKHAVLASDGKIYDAWMLQTWLWSQLNRNISDFFVIPDMPIHCIYVSESTDVVVQFLDMKNLRYIANSLYSSQFVASLLFLVKCVAHFLLSLKPKLIFLFRSLSSLPSWLAYQRNYLGYLTTKTTKDIGIQCEIVNVKDNLNTAPFSMRKPKNFRIPSENSAFYRISPVSK